MLEMAFRKVITRLTVGDFTFGDDSGRDCSGCKGGDSELVLHGVDACCEGLTSATRMRMRMKNVRK
jgi:hypothetical protein